MSPSDEAAGGGLDPVATTSRVAAAMRAVESARADRLFADPLAATLAGDEGIGAMDLLGQRGISTIPVRTRYVDDTLTGIGGVLPIVFVAAGMDTRAYRLDLPAGTVVYELDRPELLALKEHLLESVPPRRARRPVGVDLTTDWAPALTAAGLDPGQPAVWVVEGVMQYLPEDDVHRLLDRVTALAAPGSHLIADFLGRSMLESAAMRPLFEILAGHGMAFRFGTDQPEELLVPRGWDPEITLFGAYGDALGRRLFPAGAQGYLVHAVRPRRTASGSARSA